MKKRILESLQDSNSEVAASNAAAREEAAERHAAHRVSDDVQVAQGSPLSDDEPGQDAEESSSLSDHADVHDGTERPDEEPRVAVRPSSVDDGVSEDDDGVTADPSLDFAVDAADTTDIASGPITYADAGVDTREGARAVDAIRAAVKSTYRPEVIGDIGGFGGLFSASALKEMDDPILVSGTDGVGTKLAVARLLGKHDTVGIDLVAMCVNDVLATGAEPLFFLDYIAVGKLEAEQVATVVSGIADGCRQAGCALIGGEMAEHPGVMDPDDYDLSGFCVAAVDRCDMIDPEKFVREGDTIIGLASNGIHSNGFSLVRRVVVDRVDEYTLNRVRPEFDGRSLGDVLMAPTRIYVHSIRSAMASGAPLHAVAHITGGGITENLDRVLPRGLDATIELGTWIVPPVIQYVVAAADLSEQEALRTFNMGIGMCVVCDPSDADALMVKLTEEGETCWKVGAVTMAQERDAKGCVRYMRAGTALQ